MVATVVVGQTSEVKSLLSWMDFETRAWVRAHRERGFDIRSLDDHALRMACYAELNRQLSEEGIPRREHPEMRMKPSPV